MHRRPSPATLIALIALFLSLGGSAVAANHYLVTSVREIKPSVVHQLQGHTGPAGTTGPQGPAGAQGPAGPSNLSGLIEVEGPKNTVPAEHTGSSVATCPAGDHAVSGGEALIVARDGGSASQMSEDHQSWFVVVGNSGPVQGSVQAIAYCAGAGQAIAARTNTAAHERAVREANRIAVELKAKR
ncbi:MAG: hypothetical protein WCC64_01115 [Aliidongia sp.]